ncbi:hypothetical protein [Absidia glauca]|uniref:Uncharacterized protein n=1 Tax=Absidia glauca TaxID=4829 RepID=A0A163JIN0_ABSGL|nr:hypothetical protein [Absidia glauca]
MIVHKIKSQGQSNSREISVASLKLGPRIRLGSHGDGFKLRRVLRKFLRPIHGLTACTPRPAAREPISVVIPIDHSSKKGAKAQKAIVSHGETMMDKLVRSRDLPYVRC